MSKRTIIKLRRGTASEWIASNEVLLLGEPGFEKDTKKLKIGDGITPWNSLPYINNDLLSINDALVFKGTLGVSGTISLLPTVYEAGWTYKVITAGTYANKVCDVGDFIVAIVDRPDGNGDNDDWTVIQANIENIVSITNPGDNRLLTSDGTLTGINSEQNLTFDGFRLNIDCVCPSGNSGMVVTGDNRSTVIRSNVYSDEYIIDTEDGPITTRHANRLVFLSARGNAANPSGLNVNDNIFTVLGGAYNPHGTLNAQGLIDNRTLRIQANVTDVGTHYAGSTLYVETSSGGPTLFDNTFTFSHLGVFNAPYDIQIGGISVSLTGHTHSVSDITDFDISVSGLLPIVANSGDNRILTSTGTSTGINGESNLTFDGTTLAVSGVIDIDNLRLDGNTISSTNSNGNIVLAPNGTGDVYVDADTLRVGDSNSNTTITTNGTGDLTLNTNSGNNSGSITIEDGANNDITISPNGTGQIILGKQNSASDPQELSFANGNFSLDGDARFSSYVLKRTTSSSGWNSLYLNYPTNSDDTITIDDTTATFSIHISGRSSNNGDSAGFVIRGCVKKYSSTVSLVGSPVIESFLDNNFATANAQISTSSNGLVIQVDQGSSGVSGTVYWVASVQISRVKV